MVLDKVLSNTSQEQYTQSNIFQKNVFIKLDLIEFGLQYKTYKLLTPVTYNARLIF